VFPFPGVGLHVPALEQNATMRFSASYAMLAGTVLAALMFPAASYPQPTTWLLPLNDPGAQGSLPAGVRFATVRLPELS
jgi:hypothetical protein